MPLLILFILAVAELWVIIKVGSHIGALATLILIILCSVVGLNIARVQGIGMLRDMQERLHKGLDADKAVPEGMMLMLAAVLLIIPGFITGIAGLLLLVPFVRSLAAARLPRFFRGRTVVSRHVVFDVRPNRPPERPDARDEDEHPGMIEVQAKVIEPEKKEPSDKDK